MRQVLILILLNSPGALAQSLQEVVVAPLTVKPQTFSDGADLGKGAVEKEYELPVKTIPAQIISAKKRRARTIASVKKPVEAERSIASYPDDRKFSNEVLAQVRQKDAVDREETLGLVRAAIERGEFGADAKARLERVK